jgi:hypothetical protein
LVKYGGPAHFGEEDRLGGCHRRACVGVWSRNLHPEAGLMIMFDNQYVDVVSQKKKMSLFSSLGHPDEPKQFP